MNSLARVSPGRPLRCSFDVELGGAFLPAAVEAGWDPDWDIIFAETPEIIASSDA